jgi:hypothetical protein
VRVIPIKKEETYEWLLYKHYLKRLAPISYAYGLYDESTLMGICTFGVPASASLCMGICGVDYADIVLELNRLCVDTVPPNSLSFFVGRCLKRLPTPSIIVSYADTNQHHIGYIYQATNWLYTGLSAKRTDCKIIGDEDTTKHSRHLFDKYGGINAIKEQYPDKVHWVDRPQKHRYIYFLGSKKQKKEMRRKLKYQIEPYPKGDNQKYDASYQPKTQEVLF